MTSTTKSDHTKKLSAAAEEFFRRVWYVRSRVRMAEEGLTAPPDIEIGAANARAKCEKEFGLESLEKPLHNDWEYGFITGKITGKLSALRWVLGDEWDFLDT